MLIRVYRLTDKVGIVILKMSSAMGEWLMASAARIVAVTGRGTGGILGILLAIVGILVAMFQTILRTIWRALQFLGGLGLQLLSLAGIRLGRSIQTGGAAIRPHAGQAQSMVRRAVYDEVDVQVAEDPLKIENRRLSFLVLFLGILVIGAIIWATDPNRTTVPMSAANSAGSTNPASLLRGETPQPTDENLPVAAGIATPIPTATQVPDVLRVRGTIAYSVRERGQTDLWLMGVSSRNPIRITNSPADERDPAWNLDGTRLAYASRQNGNWDLYVYDLATQASSRVTVDLSFQGNPSWSPDGLWLVYESYQTQNPSQQPNLNIYAVPIDGSEAPLPLTTHPAPDFAPVWSPLDGRQIAFVSWRDGNQDIYIFNLDTLEIFNLTNTPLLNENHPAWSPDGRFIAYSVQEQGMERVFVRSVTDPATSATLIGLGRAPSWSPDGASVVFAVDAIDGSQTYMQAVPFGREGGVPVDVGAVIYGATSPTWSEQPVPLQLANSGGLSLGVSEPLFIEQTNESAQPPIYRLSSLGNVQVEQPFMSDSVNDSFDALRQRIREVTGIDFLQQLDDAFWTLERLPEPGEPRRNWHMTGRAFSIQRNLFLGFPPPIEIVREDIGAQTYWRIFVRVDEDQQSGQLGEPLRTLPWDFASAAQGDIEAFNQGGRLKAEVPVGYYVDFTQVAADYGWERQAATQDWRSNSRGRNYWLFVKDDDLDWFSAMLEIHTEGELINFAPTAQPGQVPGA